MRRVLHLTDPHVVVPPEKVSGKLETADLLDAAVARILQNWSKLAPIDAVVVTGDITDRGDTESYALFRKLVHRLPAPVFVIPGNHDRREAMRGGFADNDFMAATGKLNWSYDFTDLRIVGVDTLIEGSGSGLFDEVAESFVKTALQTAAARPVLIALHHPPFSSGIRFMDALGLDGVERLAAALDFAQSPVRIICGHVHSTIVANVGPHTAIASPGICSTFDTDYRSDAPVGYTTQPGGYMVHTVDKSGFRSTAISLAQGDGPFSF